MLMVHSAMAAMTGAGLGSAKDYAGWLAHIAERAPTMRNENQNPTTDEVQRVQMGGDQGVMSGSSWVQSASAYGAYFGGRIGRAVQHGMPSSAAYDAQRAAASVVICAVEFNNATFTLSGRTRNGYASTTAAPSAQWIMSELSYWDFTLEKPMTMKPKDNLGPFDYAAAGW